MVCKHHLGAMHLPDIVNRLNQPPHRLEGTDAIGAHVLEVIAHAAAHVQRSPRRRAYPSLAGKDCLGHPGGENIESIVSNTVLL